VPFKLKAVPKIPRRPHQSASNRFATLLLYLNEEGLQGGETTFPRWKNAESFDQLRVKPEEGKVGVASVLYTIYFKPMPPLLTDCGSY
jgi:hypothetical protein